MNSKQDDYRNICEQLSRDLAKAREQIEALGTENMRLWAVAYAAMRVVKRQGKDLGPTQELRFTLKALDTA